MKYAIVFSSPTGNTAGLAEKIASILPREDSVYYGPPDPKAQEAALIFLGFWTDKGDCDPPTAEFIEALSGKKLFLFGTAGFGGDEAYFAQILSRVEGHIPASNTVVGAYMCQGKMPPSVRKRYEGMLAKEPEKIKPLLDNYDRALLHPNAADLKQLEQKVQQLRL